MNNTNLEKLTKVLAEIFQLDQADLDFGIYRIMNQKRGEIVRFLDNDLLPQVKEAFSQYRSADKGVIEAEIAKATEQAHALGVNPEETAKVKELRATLAGASVDIGALENEVFSHLASFFRRYYNEGDFISLRRYKEGVYAIPYEGEEVKLHWANADQYYVKSSETFRDYTFKTQSGKRVRVHLVAASTEQDNNKAAPGNERRFVLCDSKPLTEENGELYIRFEYRPSEGKETRPLRFDERLVLNQWMLSLFERQDFEGVAKQLKSTDLEGLDENNVHKFLHQVRLLWEFPAFPGDTLLGYDQNIVRHTLRLSERRDQPIRWKYFQWLSLLFTEIYLDRFFRDPGRLLSDLNAHVARFNIDKTPKDQIPSFELGDLTKIAFWSATGSGKTLLMHANILQYRHYLDLHGQGRKLNRILVLTPNEGLSRQHLVEFQAAGLDAALFSKDGASLFSGRDIEIIDIHKLREEMGEKTVAIDAFEGNNLVLVDEGHRGASGTEVGRWMQARNRLCENGFSFEYSATFGQAMKGKSGLEKQYAKCILFDYSYKYFYRDGFGKDYRILNLADDSDEEKRQLYLTACLLTFYQQQKLYRDKASEFRPFLLESPLWVFVGGTVNAVRSEKGHKVSDVVDILRFLGEFVKDRGQTVQLLKRLTSGKPGLLDQHGKEIFATAFSYLAKLGLTPDEAYDDILRLLFNSPAQAALHVENLKGADGEIALRLGENEPFGLINVGDAQALCKLCEEQGNLLVVTEKEFSGSFFAGLDDGDSTVNVLIGSKKFTEGWNSWRVSTMGLMNVGKSEGSEIIQLFGRGVRLKGYGMCLKRSSQIEHTPRPPHIGLLETLNIFGIRAQYMQQFKEYLEDEGLPTNEDRIEFVLPVVKNLDGRRLTSIRLKEGVDFKRHGPKPMLADPPERLLRQPVVVNWYPKIQSQQSKGVTRTDDTAVLDVCAFNERHLAFMDMDVIWFELQRFKNERAWYNLNLPREAVSPLLAKPGWYRLYIPKAEMEFSRFDRV
jgi:superfamily II DNA or RNA helicase